MELTSTKKERNNTVDILRGLAMALVVLGHTMTGSSLNSEKSFLFNVIWTLQMPLFVLISGYITRYSKISNFKNFFKKRTISYLLPYIIWTFLIRGIVFSTNGIPKISYVIFHMDDGYWFLFTIWTITMEYGIAQYFSNKLSNQWKWHSFTAIFIIEMCAIALVGKIMGLSFLGIKLTLYYMPFYYLGYLYGQMQDKLFLHKNILEVIVAISLLLWLYLLNRYSFFSIEDNLSGIIIRVITSLTGCVAVCGIISSYMENCTKNLGGALRFIGIHTIDVYLTHYLFLNLLKVDELKNILNVIGFLTVIVNYVLTMLIVMIVIIVLKENKLLQKILFGKLI